MALLPILEFPDTRLRIRAKPVEHFDAQLRQLIADMLETMYAAPGVGLAGTQVNVHRHIFVMDTSAEKNDPQAYINTEILERDEIQVAEEGCLSVPTIFEPVRRATRVRIRAQDAEGAVFERELTGLAAVCVQHEMDHLAGKLFVDYLTALKRERIRRRLEKERRERGGSASPSAPRSAEPAL
jgi:peptide deformylase